MDNRPLRFEEWDAMRPQTTYVSATPGGWELGQTGGTFVEQVIRPTGLIDPPVEVRPAKSQVDDLIDEVRQVARAGYRTLVTVLTKRMAEDLTEYMHEQGIRVRYMHSDIETLERIEIIRDLRLGAYDVLIGINLLREGLDIPECALVAILDADKEGFLRSETSLVQTIGRAARNLDGKVILYADAMTGSMQRAMAETNRRREKQTAWNAANGITPESVKKNISDVLSSVYEQDHVTVDTGLAEHGQALIGHNLEAVIAGWRRRCMPPRPIWSSRPPPACATRSNACARPSSPWPTTPSPARPTSRTKPAPTAASASTAALRLLPLPAHADLSAHALSAGRGAAANAGASRYPSPNPLPILKKNGERESGTSRIQREYQPVQPTFAQTTSVPGSRVRKPSLDEMGSHSNRPIPARTPMSTPAPRPAPTANRCAGPISPPSTRWARTPSAACRSPTRRCRPSHERRPCSRGRTPRAAGSTHSQA